VEAAFVAAAPLSDDDPLGGPPPVPAKPDAETLAARMHELFRGGVTPAPVLTARCRSCSLIEICQPSAIGKRGSARAFFRRSLAAVALRDEGES